MSIIRTILILIAAYYIIRFINTYILPAFKSSDKPEPQKTPRVTIDYAPKQKKKTDQKNDDYIEYEEVK